MHMALVLMLHASRVDVDMDVRRPGSWSPLVATAASACLFSVAAIALRRTACSSHLFFAFAPPSQARWLRSV